MLGGVGIRVQRGGFRVWGSGSRACGVLGRLRD